MQLNIEQLRDETPGTQSVIHFNNAGCSLPTKETVDVITEYLQMEAVTGGYELKEKYQTILDQFYKEAAQLINTSEDEIAITANASDSFNKAIYAIPFQKGDIVLASEVEYGNSYINFLKLKEEKGIEIQIIPSDEYGNLLLEKLEAMISPQVKLIAITHIPTNSGLITDAESIGAIAKKHNILYILDACQSVGHIPVDVEKIQCDFLTATSRKYLRGPRGLGFLYVKKAILKKLKPMSLDMVTAHWENADSYQLDLNIKMFEQWEKPYALVLGFSKAIAYLNQLGIENTWKRIQELSSYLRDNLKKIEGVTVRDIGTNQCGIVTFNIGSIPPEDVVKALLQNKINTSVSARFSTVLDMDKRGLSAVNRASLQYYNTKEEIDVFVEFIKIAATQIPEYQ